MQHTLIAVLVVVPWINPLSYGPTPSVIGTLVSLASAGAICLLALMWPPHRGTVGPSNTLTARPIGLAWIAAAAFSAVVALLQYFDAASLLVPWVSASPLGEAYANLRQRNQFATLTNIGLAAVLWWQTSDPHVPLFRRVSGQTSEALVFAAAALLVTANAASSSRTGLLQLFLLAGIVFLWRRKDLQWCAQPACRIMLGCLVVYAFASVALPLLIGLDPNHSGIFYRLKSADSTCQSRLTLWANVLHLIAQKPWFGWGWGELDYAHFMTLYPGARFCDILDNAHNLPLHLAVELGVPFAVLACGLAGWLVLRNKPWRETHPTRQMAWSVLALIGLHSMLEYPLWYGPFQMATMLSIYMLWIQPTDSAQGDAGKQPNALMQPARQIASVVSAALLISCAYAAWDYWRVSQIYIAPEERAASYRDATLQKIQGSRLFENQVRFAELTTTPLTRDNAARLHAMALEMLHFSPEPKVVRILINSAVMLGLDDEAVFYLQRFKVAFPGQALQG